jgi:hypothetical protein
MSVFTNSHSRSLEQARAYTEAAVALVAGRNPLDVLRATPAGLRGALDGLGESQWRTPEAEGKWSIGQVIRHLADAGNVWGWRLRLRDAPIARRPGAHP